MSYRRRHNELRYHVVVFGVGDLQGMSCMSFVSWMGEGPIDCTTGVCTSTMRGMECFLKYWDTLNFK